MDDVAAEERGGGDGEGEGDGGEEGGEEQEALAMEEESGVWEPPGRRGGCSFAFEGYIYVMHGQEGVWGIAGPSAVTLARFSPAEGRWEEVETSGDIDHNNFVSSACCTLLGERVVTFGGWSEGLRVAHVRELDLRSMHWRQCKVENPSEGPLNKDKAGMVAYGNDMVCIIGGYGYQSTHYNQTPQPGAQYKAEWGSSIAWTNEVHLFQISKGVWISPEMTGQRPPPCAAFTINMVDSHRAVLFGGRQLLQRVHHIYILNLETWHWEGAFLPSPLPPHEPWPTPRSFHAACSLVDPSCIPGPAHLPYSSSSPPTHYTPPRFDWLPCTPPDLRSLHPDPSLKPRLLLLWGMDNAGNPVQDCWTLQLDPVTWKKVTIPGCVPYQPRLWHTLGVWHPSPSEAQVLVFGGSTFNIFEDIEPVYPCKAGTTLLEFGVPSLYRLCVEAVSSLHNPLLSSLLSLFLPSHILEELHREHLAENNKFYFCTAHL